MKKIKLFAMALMSLMATGAMAEELVIANSDANYRPTPEQGTFTANFTKGNSTSGIKIGSDGNYVQWVLGKATIEHASFNGYINTTTVAGKNWGIQFTTDNGTTWETEFALPNTGVKTDQVYTIPDDSIPAGANGMRIIRRAGTSCYVSKMNLDYGGGVPYPYVKSFTMGAIKAAVDTAAKTITAELPYGSNRNEEIKNAVIKMGGTAKTYSFNTDTTIMTAIDSAEVAKNVDYALNITVNANPSDDATLKSLSVNGTAIKDFSAGVYVYDYVVKFTETTMPTLSAEVNEAHAQKVINDVTEIPGAATVVVTAQDGTTQLTYTVNFTRATADKTLYEVVFSNGVKGAIFNVEDDYRIEVPYLAGQGEPTYVSDSVAAGAKVSVEGDKLTVTAGDSTKQEYSIYFIELSAPAFTTDTITFDSTETYIYGHYGWDSSKGWKFAKAVNSEGNMRIAEGKTRIYMALPACGKVTLISGAGGARAVTVSANGHTPASLTTGKANAGMDIYPSSSEVNFIAIESNQTNGDGGFIKMVMSNEGPATKLSDMKAGEKAEKFILNGKVYFRHNDQVFNALGQEMK